MAKGRWKFTDEQIAIEAFAVLMRREKPGRTLGREDLQVYLKEPSVYQDFLKLCLEHDETKDMSLFRKGLLLVIKSTGVSQLSTETGLSRLSLYRMLSRQGNPRFASLLGVFRALRLRLWLVDGEFLARRQKVVRPKDIPANASMARRPGKLGLPVQAPSPKPTVIIRRRSNRN